MTAQELEEFLHRQIPISKALGVRVQSIDEASVAIAAPLSPNINHLGTAFGGSLAAISILAGYAWIFQALLARGHAVHVILKSTAIDYEQPVEGDFVAVCDAPAPEKFAAFLKTFERKGLARIVLESQIETASGVACALKGEFVARSH